MTAATLTRPTTTPAPTTAPRACWWELAPYELADGRLMGHLGIRVGRVRDWYRAVRQVADDFGEVWSLAKELPSGEYQEAYSVRLPAAGSHTTPVCSCPGWRFGGKCRHTASLRAILTTTK